MRSRRLIWGMALAVLGLLLVWGGWVIGRSPYLLVRLEFARQRVAAGLDRGEATVDGTRWVYAMRTADRPEAPTLVLLHGFTGSKENWYPLAKALGGRYRLLIPDLPGWGESERKPGVALGFVGQAEQVAAFLRAQAKGQPVVLVGHSMGGGIAAVTAARYPQLVSKVALFNAAGVRFKDNAFGLSVLAGDNPFAVHDAASLQRYIDTVFHVEAAKPAIPWPASAALIDKRRADAAFEQAVLDRIGRSEETLLPGEEAARIHQPALLLWCRQDAVIDASALELYAARMPQARKVLLEGCGHMSLMERPHAVADAVVKWLTNDAKE